MTKRLKIVVNPGKREQFSTRVNFLATQDSSMLKKPRVGRGGAGGRGLHNRLLRAGDVVLIMERAGQLLRNHVAVETD